MFRRARRNRKTRYREARFDNRKRGENWLPPSAAHRVLSVRNLAEKLKKHFLIGQISVETAKFDTQRMQNAEISGVEYQKGTLQGWDVREYVLWKFNHQCVYCGTKEAKFELDHVIPKSRGGSDRVSNLVLACRSCNQAKDDLSLEEFCPDRAEEIRKRLKAPLKDASAMNAIRYRLVDELKNTGIETGISFGSQTKYNRHRYNIPKEHCLDALFSGETREIRGWESLPVVEIKCMGRGTRSRTLLSAHGFPRAFLPRQKVFFGFQTGDMAKAIVPKGKKAGTYVGRVAVRSRGYFALKTDSAIIDVNHKYLKLIQRGDGYAYSTWRQKLRNSSPS